MDIYLYTGFIIASVLLIALPGPNILVIVSTSLSHGSRRGLQTVFGTTAAMSIQLLIAALSTSWFVAYLANGFEWLRWFGVAYLIFIGLSYLSKYVKPGLASVSELTSGGTFFRGFIVSLTNPKTILFFGAFLPQFISPDGVYLTQIFTLSITFLVLAALIDGFYAIMAARVAGITQGKKLQRWQNGLSGVFFLGAGAWLAAMRKT